MSLKPLLQLLHEVAFKEGVSLPFICGGVPRDKVIGTLANNFNDLDITNGDSSIFQLAKEFSIKLKHYIPLTMKQATDGHMTIYLPKLKIDFSSNFLVPGIDDILKNKGINNPTDMQKELFSRDFFCNTLLMSLDFKQIKDLTGEGVKDIKNKIIRTCLTPEQTFTHNTKRIIRVIYLAAKLGFDVDPQIINWVSKNQKYNLEVGDEYLTKNINKALQYDPNKTVQLLSQMKLWDFVPMTVELYPYRERALKGRGV